jgi:hypothetical protein
MVPPVGIGPSFPARKDEYLLKFKIVERIRLLAAIYAPLSYFRTEDVEA